jgi:hypothetical protein
MTTIIMWIRVKGEHQFYYPYFSSQVELILLYSIFCNYLLNAAIFSDVSSCMFLYYEMKVYILFLESYSFRGLQLYSNEIMSFIFCLCLLFL